MGFFDLCFGAGAGPRPSPPQETSSQSRSADSVRPESSASGSIGSRRGSRKLKEDDPEKYVDICEMLGIYTPEPPMAPNQAHLGRQPEPQVGKALMALEEKTVR